ncbi:MAG: YcaQ family DNA glycosylase [Deltaproteobacteria bacterium]|nr:YcaQ family DNA glycosylase [Deltaproteobacteria bacterium]MBW2447632.1 YcaQ family DNA glycosylase [Deltaproteobacteria bacterium]
MPARPLLPVEVARKMLLGGQGLLADPARRATKASVLRQIEAMGFVQVDSINIVERAHHHILASRFDGYRPALLTRLVERDRSLFEHWTHDASIIPVAWFAHWKPRFASYHRPDRPWGRWLARRTKPRPREVIAQVRSRIEREGPLMSRDFEHASPRKNQGWWDWKPQKQALEFLWRTGELSIAKRVSFAKVYDLTERWLPEVASVATPAPEAQLDWACRNGLERLGFATASEIQHFFDAVPLADVRAWCRDAAAHGEIVEVEVAGADGSKPRCGFAFADWERRARRLPDAPERMRLLSPFDPVIRDRKRALRLFGFEYSFEAFVPAPKRRFGYYVLPLLEGDRFVGRLDPKFERDHGELVVRRVWWEPGVQPTRARKRALADAADRFAEQIGAETCRLPAVSSRTES